MSEHAGTVLHESKHGVTMRTEAAADLSHKFNLQTDYYMHDKQAASANAAHAPVTCKYNCANSRSLLLPSRSGAASL